MFRLAGLLLSLPLDVLVHLHFVYWDTVADAATLTDVAKNCAYLLVTLRKVGILLNQLSSMKGKQTAPPPSIVQRSEANLNRNGDKDCHGRYLTKRPLAVRVGIPCILSHLLLKSSQSEYSPQLAYCKDG